MKKVLFSLILLTIFLTKGAFCYTLSNLELKQIIKEKISTALDKKLDYDIRISNIPFDNIITNENIKPKVEVISQPNNPYKRIIIKDSKGAIVKSFPLNVQVLIYQDVLVAASQINYNDEINSRNTLLERREVSRYLNKTLNNIPNNTLATRNYQKGSIILANSIKQKAVILKNTPVDITFLSKKGLKITLRGQALKDGAIGETIPVRSDKYNKTYNATVESQTEVTVRI